MEKESTSVYLRSDRFGFNEFGSRVAVGKEYTRVAPESGHGSRFPVDAVEQRTDFYATHISEENLEDPTVDYWSVAKVPVSATSKHEVFSYKKEDPFVDLAAKVDERFPIGESSEYKGYTIIISS